MSYNGSGVFNRLYSWVADAAAGINIKADKMDAEFDGIATALSNVLTRDGQAGMEAPLDMGGFAIRDVADPVNLQDAVTKKFLEANYGKLSFPTIAAFDAANAINPGLGLTDGFVIIAGGYEFRRLAASTAIPGRAGWVPNGKSTPFHFGAVGNNIFDDRPAFVSMNAYGGDVYLPRPPVAWNVSSAINMNVVSVEIDPTLTWTQATDAGAINWGAATNDFYPDQDGVHIRRESNRLFVFQGADFTGNFGGSQQGFVPTLTEGANWGPRDAALFVAQDRGLLSVVGFSSNVNENRDDAIANCAIAGFAIGNKNTGVGGSSARTFYGDLQFEDGQFGFGIELALKNKTGVTIDCTPYTKNLKVTGFWVVPGGDASYGGAANADVCVAMAFGGGTGAGMKFNKGIVFWENSLRPDVNGRGQALSLGQSQELAWYSTGTGTFKITSSGQTTVSTELLSNNLGINVRGFTTETQTFGVGQSRTGDGRSQVHLYADGAGQQSMSFIAYPGANGIRDLRTRGTGALQIVAQDAAPVLLATNNTTRVTVEADGRVGIGAPPLVSSAFAVTSTAGGLLFPRMTTAQRDAIPSQVDGLAMYNLTTGKLQVRAAGVWVDLH